nr:ubiquitin-activating enzyme E1 1-like [Tanacetum cinerariifolium]GEY21148.1 ubiquitin-activating enzyme E1 1-like [Tanacetum cinerariifolium]
MRKLFGANVMISGMQALGAKTGGSISNMAAIKKTARDRVGSWKPTTVLCMVSGYKADNYCFSAERVDTGCGSQENHSWARLRVQDVEV